MTTHAALTTTVSHRTVSRGSRMICAAIGLRLERALAIATHSGSSLGRPGQLGRVAAGQLADLVLLDTTGPHHLGTDHPIPAALAIHGRSADGAMVIVDGCIVVERGSAVIVAAPVADFARGLEALTRRGAPTIITQVRRHIEETVCSPDASSPT